MQPSKKLTRREIAAFNTNCIRLSERERCTFLERWAREAATAPCNPDTLKDLIKWLSRQVRGQHVQRTKIAADAAAILHFGMRARHAIAFKRSPAKDFDAAATIVARYASEIIRRADPFGMAMGIKFTGGAFRRPSLFGPEHATSNIFFVA